MIAIKPAKSDDATALSEYMARRFNDTFGHIYDPQDLADFLDAKYNPEITLGHIENPDNFIRIAWENSEIKGYIFGGFMSLPYDSFAKGAFEIYRFYVSDDQKGSGLAKKLYLELMQHVKIIGAPELFLGVWSLNERALSFYKKLGFEIVGKYLYQVGKTMDDERIMRLKL
jgi:ribosomal protein S18 acetylase RimI-like enzyme